MGAIVEADGQEMGAEFGAEFGEEGDEFGGRKARRSKRARRKARRKKRKVRRRRIVKKVGRSLKPIGKLLRSKVVKKLIGLIPGYGTAIVAAIEAGGTVADEVRKSLDDADKQVEHVEELRRAVKGASGQQRAQLQAELARAESDARKALKSAAGGVKKLAAMEARKSAETQKAAAKLRIAAQRSPKARAALRVVAARSRGDKRAYRAARRAAAKMGVKTDGDLRKAAAKKVESATRAKAPKRGEVVVLLEGKTFRFPRRALR